MIVRPNTLPEPRPVDMDGLPVDLDPKPIELSWWDRAWEWLFGAAIGGLTRKGVGCDHAGN